MALGSAGAWAAIHVARSLFLGVAMGLVAATVALRGRRDLVLLPAITAVTLLVITFPALSYWPAPPLIGMSLGLAASRFRAPWLARGQLDGAVAGWT